MPSKIGISMFVRNISRNIFSTKLLSRTRKAGLRGDSRLQIKHRGLLRRFNASLACRRLGEGGNASTTLHLMRSSTASATSLFICLAFLASLATASGQLAPTYAAPRNEPLEKYDNPPALPRKMETSPRMISQFGVFTSYQANVNANGQNILGDAANECAISVDPTDGNKMTIAWRQFNDVTSNFRQGGWGYTTDAGITWTFPGVLQNNVFRSDPVTQSNEVGQFFYLSLQSDVQQSFFCDDLWRSTNGGQIWTEQSPDRSAGGDKQWFTIDKTNGPGYGFQYQVNDSANCAGTNAAFQ